MFLQIDENDLVKNVWIITGGCKTLGSRKKIWSGAVEKDCWTWQINMGEAMDRSKLDRKYSVRVQIPAKVCHQHLATLATPIKFLQLQFKFSFS